MHGCGAHPRGPKQNLRSVAPSFQPAPDGDADIEMDFSTVEVPLCEACGGILKPHVVFFGDLSGNLLLFLNQLSIFQKSGARGD